MANQVINMVTLLRTINKIKALLDERAPIDHEHNIFDIELPEGVNIYYNPNLLRNWDMTKIVNQQKQQVYTTSGYSIDMWFSGADGITHSIESGCLVVSRDAGSQDTVQPTFCQFIEHPEQLSGRKLTFSAKFHDLVDHPIEIGSNSLALRFDMSQVNGNPIVFESTCEVEDLVISTTIEVPPIDITDIIVSLVMRNPAGIEPFQYCLQRIKLEVGSMNTLELDPPINYADELMRCQRFFIRIGGIAIKKIGIGFWLDNANFVCTIPLGIQMAMTPRVITSTPLSNLTIQAPGNNYVAITDVSVDSISDNGITLNIRANGNRGDSGILRLINNAYVDLDATP